MDLEHRTLHEAVSTLPWFADLSAAHRRDFLEAVIPLMYRETSRADFTSLFNAWAGIAHQDAKW